LLDTSAEGQHVPRAIEIRLGKGVELTVAGALTIDLTITAATLSGT
jgi:hypothetical protein